MKKGIKIIDMHGCELQVEDLDRAIQQSGQFKEYAVKGDNFSDFNQRQKLYWSDVHEKLTALRGQSGI